MMAQTNLSANLPWRRLVQPLITQKAVVAIRFREYYKHMKYRRAVQVIIECDCDCRINVKSINSNYNIDCSPGLIGDDNSRNNAIVHSQVPYNNIMRMHDYY